MNNIFDNDMVNCPFLHVNVPRLASNGVDLLFGFLVGLFSTKVRPNFIDRNVRQFNKKRLCCKKEETFPNPATNKPELHL